ncbi:hypothetical protein SAMN04487787_1197 [Kosakonia sacchari]|nr:hypothetical protein SAMN04487787_1197 [Kosakonia sacchari]
MFVRSCFMFEGMPKEVTQISDKTQEKFMTTFVLLLARQQKLIVLYNKKR